MRPGRREAMRGSGLRARRSAVGTRTAYPQAVTRDRATPAPAPAAATLDDSPDQGRALGRLAAVAIFFYLAFVAYMMILSGTWVTPDLLVIALVLLAFVIGQGKLFLRDWLPFIFIFLAWEAMRGYADNLGAPVHSDSVIALERLISFGIVPTVELQRLFHRATEANALDIATSLVYAAHFVFPLAVAFIFWLRDRSLYYRFVGTLMLMALVGFVFFLLLPVAPPRFAGRHGEDLGVADVIADTLHNIGLQTHADWIYTNLNPNDNAAFPSLHAAFPLLALLFVRRLWVPGAWLVGLWTLVVWFSIVYLGHHYIVDVLGGAALALAAYWIVIRRGALDRMLAWLMAIKVPGRLYPLRRPDRDAAG